MFEYIIKNPRVRREIEAAGFKPSLEALAARLHSQGYAKTTVCFYDQAAVHFAYWAAQRGVDASQINEAHLANFLSHHLPTCRCPFGGVRQDKTVRAGLRHLDAVLSSAGRRISNQEKSRML
jgi:integrase/recombinase XerD